MTSHSSTHRAGPWRIALALSLLIFALSYALPGWAAQTLSIGFQKGSGVLSVVKAQGTLEKRLADQGVQVRWHEFPAGPQLLEALNAGSIDFGYTGAPPPVFAQAAGIEMRYVGAIPAARDGEAILVPEDSPIRSVADLEGKRVAVQRGSSANYLLVAALAHAGLDFKAIQPAYLTPADARAAFTNGNVDAWAVWDPYLSSAEHDLDVRVLADYSQLEPTYSFYEASTAFTEEHPELLREVLDELDQTAVWASSHRDEVVSILAKELGLPEAVIDAWQRKVDYSLVPISDAVIDNQQRVANAFSDLRLIPAPVVVEEAFWRNGDDG